MLKFKEIDSLHEPSLEIYTNLSENQLYQRQERSEKRLPGSSKGSGICPENRSRSTQPKSTF